MLNIKELKDDEIKYIIDNKDINPEIKKSSDNVIVIFTQDWCPDWKSLAREIETNKNTDKYNLDIFICIYNQSSMFESFREFKETVWNNGLIPYIRYYKNAELIKETNQLPLQRIMRVFE